MKIALVMLGSLAPLFGGELNALSAEEKEAGWKLLFDGKSAEHWRNFKKEGVSEKWEVKDGALVWTEKGAGDIITKEQFDAFELTLDYKISKGGNSGLMYHVLETAGTPWQTGPEIQIQDNVDGHDPQKAGWLYQLYPADIDATKPAGEWNTLRILITPEKCVHWMNGKKYVEYVKGSKDWDERVAKSKFHKFEGFGKATKGHICLQDHGNVVSYRNIKIREVK
ncbi:MAG: 3-keto-disaccharide hydrolase [Verrucomicrobiales bacterium]